jgi:Flp pilus assembly pilin Flp
VLPHPATSGRGAVPQSRKTRSIARCHPVRSLVYDQRGLASVEYVLLACLVAVVCYLGWARLGRTVEARVAGVTAVFAQPIGEGGAGARTSVAGASSAALASGSGGGSAVAEALSAASGGGAGSASSALGAGSLPGPSAASAPAVPGAGPSSFAGGPVAAGASSSGPPASPGVAGVAGVAAGSVAGGWSSEFLRGAVEGDYAENLTGWGRAGQAAVGFIPVVGQAADVRDLSVAVRSYRNGEPGGGMGVVVAGIGFVPGIGDGIKALFRGRKAMQAAEAGSDVAVSSAPRAVEAAAPARERLGEGSFVVAHREGNEVVKDFKSTIASQWHLNDLDRAYLAQSTADLSNELRASRALRDLIPETRVSAPGQVRQEFRGGLTLEQLRARFPQAASMAEADMMRVSRAARLQRLRAPSEIGDGWRVIVDDNHANFRFDGTGRVTSWFDPIAIIPPESRRIAD